MTTTALTVTNRRLLRAGSVAATAVATSAFWLIASAAGTDFLLSDSMGSATISLPVTIAFSLVFGLLGWGALALLERFTQRARTVWTVLAVVVLLLSLLPIFAEDATTATKIALVLIHTAVAAVLIPALRRHAGRREVIPTEAHLA